MDKKERQRRLENPQPNELAVWWWSESRTKSGTSKVSLLYPVLDVSEGLEKIQEFSQRDLKDSSVVANALDLLVFDEHTEEWITWYDDSGRDIEDLLYVVELERKDGD